MLWRKRERLTQTSWRSRARTIDPRRFGLAFVGTLILCCLTVGERAKDYIPYGIRIPQLSLAYADDEHAVVERLSGGNLEIDIREQLGKLNTYAGTPVFVRAPEVPTDGTSSSTYPRLPRYFASDELAQIFKRLETDAHWKYGRVPWPTVAGRTGVIVLSWSRRLGKPNGPEWRAYDAAQSLRCFVFAELGTWPVYWEATVLPEYPALPRDGVLVEIGENPPENERLPVIADSRFEQCVDELQTRATR